MQRVTPALLAVAVVGAGLSVGCDGDPAQADTASDALDTMGEPDTATDPDVGSDAEMSSDPDIGRDSERQDAGDIPVDPDVDVALAGPEFVRVEDGALVAGADSAPVRLRGVNLSLDRIIRPDGIWTLGGCEELAEWPDTTPVTNWYSETHIEALAEIGFNAVRLDLHYRIFEHDARPGQMRDEGWTVIDAYVEWGRRHGVYVILDLHVPPGGLQSAGEGWCLWEDETNQDRVVGIRRAIAERYADEPMIAGFDLLNEPIPTPNCAPSEYSTGACAAPYGAEQWRELAQRAADAIREVDSNHLLIVERALWILDASYGSPLTDWDLDTLAALQVEIDDDNAIYDFHFYDPHGYVLQGESPAWPPDGSWPEPESTERAKDGTMWPRDRAYLDHELGLERRGAAPMRVGEWGPNASTLDDDTGGLRYMRDALEAMDTQDLHWSYYAMWNLYVVDCCSSGPTCCSGDNPTTPNEPVIELFREYFVR